MADIKGIAVNGNIIKSDSGSSSSSEGLFTIPSTISANQAQFDININWVSQKKEKLQVDVLLLKTGSDSRAYFVNSSSSYS